MAVSPTDVRRIADLARVGIDPARLSSLVNELNTILAHMEVLGAVETAPEMGDVRSETPVTAMRSDIDGTPVPLMVPRESFAPEMRDGFFLVPRLETHEGQGERSP